MCSGCIDLNNMSVSNLTIIALALVGYEIIDKDESIPILNIRYRRYQGRIEKNQYQREVSMFSILLHVTCLGFVSRDPVFFYHQPDHVTYQLTQWRHSIGINIEEISQHRTRYRIDLKKRYRPIVNSPLQKHERTGTSFLYWLHWKSKHFNWNVTEWKAIQPSLRVFSGKLFKWEPRKIPYKSLNFVACLPNPDKLSLLGDIWRANILLFSSTKYFYSWWRLSNLVELSFEYLSFSNKRKTTVLFPSLLTFLQLPMLDSQASMTYPRTETHDCGEILRRNLVPRVLSLPRESTGTSRAQTISYPACASGKMISKYGNKSAYACHICRTWFNFS